MSQQQVYKSVIALCVESKGKTKAELLLAIQNVSEIAQLELKKISEKNKKAYSKDVEYSRRKRKINNSKRAIKLCWSSRRNKKDIIIKHLKILKDLEYKGIKK